MATALTPRILDIVITKITPKTVTYELHSGRRTEQWEVPEGSTFNISTLVVGQRYIVDSKVVVVRCWDYLKKKFVMDGRYDWVTATIPVPKAKLHAQTAKQRKAREANEATPLVDTGDLFAW